MGGQIRRNGQSSEGPLTAYDFRPYQFEYKLCFSDPAGHILLNSKKKGCGQVSAIINAVYQQGACA